LKTQVLNGSEQTDGKMPDGTRVHLPGLGTAAVRGFQKSLVGAFQGSCFSVE
jgi:hypothetical protein